MEEKASNWKTEVASAFGHVIRGIRDGIEWIAKGVVYVIAGIGKGIWVALDWCFSESRPVRLIALLSILAISVALAYVTTRGAWLRTTDIGYTVLIGGLEAIVLVALPLTFYVPKWYNKTGSFIIFVAAVAMASVNAKPAINELLSKQNAVNVAANRHTADKLEEEIFGFIDPETGERIEGSGLLFQAARLEKDASDARNNNGYITASGTVDENAQAVRDKISEKQKEAERLRGQADDAEFIQRMSLATYIVSELIRGLGLKVLLGVGNAARRRKDVSTFTIDGQEVTEEELAHALQKHENQKEGGRKAARTRAARASTGRRITDGKNAKPIEEFRRAVLDMLEENKDLQQMSEEMGLTLPEFVSKVNGLFEDKELDDLGLKEMMEGLEDADKS